MTAAYLSPLAKQRVWDNNGNPAANGSISTFAAGTSTPIATYTDSTAGTPNANPVPLNFRGECDLWLKPNVAYKLQANDVNGILLWTVDNIVNSQLITLYGGVDTGIANAYILNFSASFTAYADGIQLTWIPANTNTTASTININGLGVVNIVNPDGSALSGSQILANQPAQILFKGGVFELITPSIVVVGFFTPPLVGFSGSPVGLVRYRRSGNLIGLSFNISGTSNATSFSMGGLPAIIQSLNVPQIVPCSGFIDNGVAVTSASIALVNTTTITFYKDNSATNNWTAAGVKATGSGLGTGIITLMYTA